MEPRISIITIGVKDFGRSLRFYRDGLGWPTEPAEGSDFAIFATAGTRFAIFPLEKLAEDISPEAAPAPSGFGGITLAHNVRRREDVARVLDEAEAAGARIVKPAQDASWGGHSGYFADPDGYYWEIAYAPGSQFAADGSLILDLGLEERVARALREVVTIEPYDPRWPERFVAERDHLRACLPPEMLGRIEHFGSTAVAGLSAKPVVDMLVEVRDLEEAKQRIVPVLEEQGYDYFWRPTLTDQEPFYAWFIKRDASGARTHHIHMVERDFPHWEDLRFRDYLIAHPECAQEYSRLKCDLAAAHPNDREAYTNGKSAFIAGVKEAICNA